MNSNFQLDGKVALVTGASYGIGFALAKGFAEAGAIICFNDINQDLVDKGIAAYKEIGIEAHGYVCDVTNEEQVQAMVAQIKEDVGIIDILVNNAGITKDGLILRMTEEQWDAVITTNLKSAFNFTRAVVPVMAKQRGGSIINMSSVVGENGNAGQCKYAASKAGLIGLAKSIAKEMGPRGIRCNCIAPGFIVTDMTAAIPEEMRAEWAKNIPLRRAGTPEDVAGVALFLASDMSAYVSGKVINCCGAMSC